MTPCQCPSEEVLGRYAVGALSEAEAQTLDAHVGGCTACLARLDGLADPVVATLRRPAAAAPAEPTALARAVAAVLADRPPPPPGPGPGAVLGGYRLLEEVGHGGM